MDKIELLYLPVPDLQRALSYYRDVMGWSEVWREGDSTAAIGPGDGAVAVMLDVSVDGSTQPGPMLTVDDVRAWIDQRRDSLTITAPPSEIPGGWLAVVSDPFGNATYLLDQSSGEEPE